MRKFKIGPEFNPNPCFDCPVFGACPAGNFILHLMDMADESSELMQHYSASLQPTFKHGNTGDVLNEMIALKGDVINAKVRYDTSLRAGQHFLRELVAAQEDTGRIITEGDMYQAPLEEFSEAPIFHEPGFDGITDPILLTRMVNTLVDYAERGICGAIDIQRVDET